MERFVDSTKLYENGTTLSEPFEPREVERVVAVDEAKMKLYEKEVYVYEAVEPGA